MKTWIVELRLIGKRIGRQMTVRSYKVDSQTRKSAEIKAWLKFVAKNGYREADRWKVDASWEASA